MVASDYERERVACIINNAKEIREGNILKGNQDSCEENLYEIDEAQEAEDEPVPEKATEQSEEKSQSSDYDFVSAAEEVSLNIYNALESVLLPNETHFSNCERYKKVIRLPYPALNILKFSDGNEYFSKYGSVTKLNLSRKDFECIAYQAKYLVVKSVLPNFPVGMVLTEKETENLPEEVTVETGVSALEKYAKMRGIHMDCIIHFMPIILPSVIDKNEDSIVNHIAVRDLYKALENRTRRLKMVEGIGAPAIILRNERRLMQENMDALLWNGKRGMPRMEMISGKRGEHMEVLASLKDYIANDV